MFNSTFFHEGTQTSYVLAHCIVNAHSDNGYNGQMQTRQQRPVGWVNTYYSSESGTVSMLLCFIQVQLYQSKVVLL